MKRFDKPVIFNYLSMIHYTSQGAWIIPVVIDDTVLPLWLENWLGQYFRISEQTLKTDFEKVIAMIDSVMMKKIRNISQG